MTRKLSPWFPPEIKPVRVGWYDVANLKLPPNFSPPWFMFWNGAKWTGYGSKPYELRHEGEYIQDVYWRGLARKP